MFINSVRISSTPCLTRSHAQSRGVSGRIRTWPYGRRLDLAGRFSGRIERRIVLFLEGRQAPLNPGDGLVRRFWDDLDTVAIEQGRLQYR